MQQVLVTGAAGRIGRMVRARTAPERRTLRLLDTAPITLEARERREVVQASVTDLEAMLAACDGMDAVVHLGGLAGEATWAEIRDVNIDGTYTVFEAARQSGVRRVVFASSNHAVGFVPRADGPLPDDVRARPDTYYGVSKVLGEALGSLYHDRFGLDVVCLRIGSCEDRPSDHRALATWLSPDDAAGLIDAALAHPDPGFRIVWGVSDNAERWWSLAGAEAIGYRSRDDAQAYADAVTVHDVASTEDRVGGAFTASEYFFPG